MKIRPFFPHSVHSALLQSLRKGKPLVLSGMGNNGAKSYFLSELLESREIEDVFWILNDNKEIYDLHHHLVFWAQKPVVCLDGLSAETGGKINELVASLNQGKGKIYLISKADIHLPLPAFRDIVEAGILIEKGQDLRVVEFFNRLIQIGYQPSADISLQKGECRRSGGVINVYPLNHDHVVKIEVDYDKIAGIWKYDQDTKQLGQALDSIDFLPVIPPKADSSLWESFGQNDLLLTDDLDDQEAEFAEELNKSKGWYVQLTSFPKNEDEYFHLRYLSVLKYYNIYDLLNDLRDKAQQGWTTVILTKRIEEMAAIFQEENILFAREAGDSAKIRLVDARNLENVPTSFQNPEYRVQLLTDREIFNLSRSSSRNSAEKLNLDFLTGLKVGDLVIHMDHGIGRFLGVVQKTIDDVRREYLEIAYAENDRLFIPIDQADKVSKYVGGEDNEPKLTRLGSVEWKNITQKIKQETQKIAKELLELYAKRAQLKGHNYGLDTPAQKRFEAEFPYQETPGQMKAIADVKRDMESDQPMDRLICGDVGFGKTEVAMRAAFKAVQGGRQVAFISPITILADQHYRSFLKRDTHKDIRIEMLSRFRSPKEQKIILEKVRKGEVDVLIGTHRLLQDDVKFMNLGLVILDEEQRFGVQQKEHFKKIRGQVDILTLTATPIPRTLNLPLNQLRDISTITTPPPGRLPVITEVRRYSHSLIIDAIQKEVDRGGQVYFLHNRVRTIESIAEKMRKLMPNISFLVAHGQLFPQELERRIVEFKEGKHNVLISSTIIENGIDLPNANTLIVDNSENLGLSQMYQPRGRIGRSRTQAYAFFLYQARQLRLDAKKRLRAIVEASELGSGFQVAMRDLEIRGAGDILGVNQHGTIRVVGVNHFLRMLNKTIEEMRSGGEASSGVEMQDVSIELPVSAFIPDSFIPDTKEKINAYQKLSSVQDIDLLFELRDDLVARYGSFPKEVSALFQILEIKIRAKQAGLLNVKSVANGAAGREVVLQMSEAVKAPQVVNLLNHNPQWLVSGDKLKIDVKALGFNWAEKLKENIRYLILPPNAPQKTP